MENHTLTVAEQINDKLADNIREELDWFEDRYMYLNPEETLNLAEDLHRYRVITAYIQDHELGARCAIGLYAQGYLFHVFKKHFNSWTDDSEESVAVFIRTVGRELFEELRDYGESTEDVYRVVMSWEEEEDALF